MLTLKIKYQSVINDLNNQTFGNWIDLRAAEDVTFSKAHEEAKISLGLTLQLPKGYEAHILPRSSTPSKFGLTLSHSQGIIDTEYCGPEDDWKFSARSTRKTSIVKGDRICQFRIMLSQQATPWQKFKWLFTSKIKFVFAENNNKNRGGFGSTGKK